MSKIETRLTQDYGIEYPIALAGMAFVGTAPDLAIAVCQAGAIGSLAAGPLPAEVVRTLIRAVRSATDRPLNVNFITFLVKEEQIGVCIDEAVPIVSFHWGHPSRLVIDRLHGGGIKVWEQVGSVESARRGVVPTPQTEGDISQLPFLSGQGVGLVRELRPAREILHEMIEEAAAVLSNLMAQTRD